MQLKFFNLTLYFVFLIMSLMFNLSGLNAVMITKVFYHHGKCEDKLVFYFDSQPKISRQIGIRFNQYILTGVELTQEAQDAIDQIGRYKDLDQNSFYDLNFKLNKKNLEIKIDFELSGIFKIYAAKFVPISQPHGLAIKIIKNSKNKFKSCLRKQNTKEIVLDFGHGGSDTGATLGHIQEKNIVQNVGLILAKLLEQGGYIVHLTRDGDYFVSLDERTRFANLKTRASLFVSLHANYSKNPQISGLETYFMHYDLFNNIDEGPNKISRLALNTSSKLCASKVHENLLASLAKYDVVDRKVKRAVSQVLLGVEMPAILVELGFVSNFKEAHLLDSPTYELTLAQGLYEGINAYSLAS
jgi:N-acetylmuramoyl-L-alanine amidase